MGGCIPASVPPRGQKAVRGTPQDTRGLVGLVRECLDRR